MRKVASIRKVDSLEQFIDLGIDGFIVSYSKYSSCNYSTNKKDFSLLIRKIHKYGKEVIVRLDCLYEENQLDEVKDFLLYLQDLSVDYVLLSDVAIKVIIDDFKINIKPIYAAETLLTNKYDIEQIKIDGFDSCVVSKNIPFHNMIDICESINDFCFLTISGPILMSYSRRRFISTYLGTKHEYKENYFLSEENRDLKMPIVEKKNGTWFYYCNLDSLRDYKTILSKPFKGVIFDNCLYDDNYSLGIIQIYEDMLKNNDYIFQSEKMSKLDKNIKYMEINDIKLSQLDKE